jgi:hypothetical protein
MLIRNHVLQVRVLNTICCMLTNPTYILPIIYFKRIHVSCYVGPLVTMHPQVEDGRDGLQT